MGAAVDPSKLVMRFPAAVSPAKAGLTALRIDASTGE
jgi:hypothetical protein